MRAEIGGVGPEQPFGQDGAICRATPSYRWKLPRLNSAIASNCSH